jgi:predicted Zn-dependent protease
MNLPDPRDGDALLAVARQLIDASSADETEVTLRRTEDAFVRFADTGPTQTADRSGLEVAVRARLAPEGGGPGFREARATCSSLDPAETAAALERALALARVSPVTVDAPPLGGSVDLCESQVSEATVGHPISAKAAWVKASVSACAAEGLAPAGLAQTTVVGTALANSCGRAVFSSQGRAALALTASDPEGGAGWADAITADVEDLDAESVVERAVAKACSNRRPGLIEAGEYTVVIEPAAVSSLLLFASYQGFGAREVHEESSFLCGRIGTRVFAPEISITDNALDPRYPGCPFDGEGTPRRVVELVRKGVLGEPVTDALWAARLGRENTGHGGSQPDPHGPFAWNLVLAEGDMSKEELMAGVKRGLLVTQFHYTNMIEPRELMLTGMTRNGTYLIENGEVTGSVRNLRFTDSLVRILSAVSGVGRDITVSGALFDGEILTPTLRVEGFRFTSTTDF